MPSRPFSLLLACASVLGAAAACSSDPDPAPNPAAQADAGSGPSPLGEKCAAEPTRDSCARCCGHTATVLAPYLRGYETCACKTACTKECATSLCAANPTDPSAECEACLNVDQTIFTCEPEGNDACDQDPSCHSFRICGDDAQCLDKAIEPTDAG